MSWTFQQKLRFGFWLLTAIPIVLGLVAYRYADRAVDAREDVAQTNEIVKTLEQLLSQLKDVEVSQREFVLTGEQHHVVDINRSRAKFDEGVQNLSRLGANRMWLEHLRSLIPQKFDEVQKTIDMRREAGLEAASQVLLTDRGSKAMDDIRKTVSNMITEENRQLDERAAAQRDSFMDTMGIFALVLLLNAILIWAIAYRVRHEQRHIESLNEDLERRVALRTEALQRSNEDLQQFAYIASHDLKEPLRMISSYTTLLERRYKGQLDSDAETYIGFIVDGAKRMNALISDLLEYSRAGEVPEEALVPVDTEAIVRSVLQNLKVTIAESRAKVSVRKLPPVTGDPMRLTQIFQNLVGNAIKYRGSKQPEIEIAATTTDTETQFYVKDNGIGIDPKDVDAIFGIFKRLHAKEYEGTGIGLAMVKKIVERLGGRIWVESSPGVGSTFYFTVPHQTAPAAESMTA